MCALYNGTIIYYYYYGVGYILFIVIQAYNTKYILETKNAYKKCEKLRYQCINY